MDPRNLFHQNTGSCKGGGRKNQKHGGHHTNKACLINRMWSHMDSQRARQPAQVKVWQRKGLQNNCSISPGSKSLERVTDLVSIIYSQYSLSLPSAVLSLRLCLNPRTNLRGGEGIKNIYTSALSLSIITGEVLNHLVSDDIKSRSTGKRGHVSTLIMQPLYYLLGLSCVTFHLKGTK